MIDEKIVILLVEDNKDFARLVEIFLKKQEPEKFIVIWKDNGKAALNEVESNKNIDVILMDYFLPGMNGLEITKTLQDKKILLPIIFLTVNKDFDLAVEVMKQNVEEYLIKEEITSPLLPKTIYEVLERFRMKQKLFDYEISQKRLQIMQKVIASVVGNISGPVENVRKEVEKLKIFDTNEQAGTYIKIIYDNFQRVNEKFEKIKSLKQDKTITYIKGIKMIDLN